MWGAGSVLRGEYPELNFKEGVGVSWEGTQRWEAILDRGKTLVKS